MSALSNRIKKLMAERQMTVKTLSETSGVSLTYLYDILADKVDSGTISVGKLEQITKALNSSLTEITHDPYFSAIKKMRDEMSEANLALVDAILSLDRNDWRRKAIMHMFGINHDSQKDREETESDDD